jgi:hypothetical protein
LPANVSVMRWLVMGVESMNKSRLSRVVIEITES